MNDTRHLPVQGTPPTAENAHAREGAATTPGQAVVVRGLTRRFGDLVAVDGIDLDITAGSIFGLIGPDGAGKTTLIRMLATVLDASDGDAEVFGASVTRDKPRVTPRIGYMPQKFCMYPDLTVAENIEYFATLRGVGRRDRRDRTVRLLESMGLAEFSARRSGTLSGGMKQKLMLATTLMHEPDLLLLDEPTTGVDPVSRREFWRILAGLHREGRTILVATPYMDEAERCTDIAFVSDGRLSERGPIGEVSARVPGTLLEVGGASPRSIATVLGDAALSAHVHGDVVRVLWDTGARDGSDTDTDDTRAASAVSAVTGMLDRAGVTGTHARPIRVDMEAAFAVLAAGTEHRATS